jgi:DNA-binding CsgD family transcriptional regulator
MATLTEHDYHDLLGVLYSVNCCKDADSFLGVLMPSLVQLFKCECVTFHLVKGYPWHIKMVESRAFKTGEHDLCEDKVFPALYTSGLYQKSPLLKQALTSSNTVLKIGESISFKDWEASDLYNDFILPQNLYRELFMTLRWKNRLDGMITLWRSRKQPDYQPEDISRAQILAPHLTVAMRNISTVARVNNWNEQISPLEEGENEGFILMNQRLKPIFFNSKAWHLCWQINSNPRSIPTISFGREFPIPEAVIGDCLELLDQLNIDEAPVLWPKARVIISPGNLKVFLVTSLIWKSDQAGAKPSFIVTLKELVDDHEQSANLKNRCNLSKRELEIIYYIVKGLSQGEIADKLFISKLTVHTHVKNIYRKLGAKNRIELYRYVQAPNWPWLSSTGQLSKDTPGPEVASFE